MGRLSAISLPGSRAPKKESQPPEDLSFAPKIIRNCRKLGPPKVLPRNGIARLRKEDGRRRGDQTHRSKCDWERRIRLAEKGAKVTGGRKRPEGKEGGKQGQGSSLLGSTAATAHQLKGPIRIMNPYPVLSGAVKL